MWRRFFVVAAGAAILACANAAPVQAQSEALTLPQVRNAVYRGTLLCGKLPFQDAAAREAIEVTIAGDFARYSHVVRDQTRSSTEYGIGMVDGRRIALKGSWRGWGDSYEASYEGDVVRRSARISGTQTWTHAGRTYTRRCAGAIKRPFAVFLPRAGKKPMADDDE
jgi:hypothetical protein